MLYVYLVYGLSFFVLWTILLIYHMKLSRFTLARNLWMIGLFGLTHGMSDWTSMIIFIQKLQGPAFRIVSLVLLIVSFYFLVQFGVSSITLKHKKRFFKLIPVLPFIPLVFFISVSDQKFLAGDIFSRYFLAVPGSILTYYALRLQLPALKKLGYPRVTKDLKLASIAFLGYGFFTGMVVPEAGFFPASALNYRTFMSALGLPVELFRALCILTIAFSLTRLLHLFELEIESTFRRTNQELEERVKERTEELNRVNEALKLRELEQKAILENVPDMVWLKDRESRFVRVNESFARSAGTTPEQLVSKNDFDIWPRELAEGYRADDREVMHSGRRKQVEEPLVDKDGSRRWVETIKTPIYNERGEIIGTTGIARDVSERREAEEALRESESRYRAITETALDAVVTIDQEGQIMLANPAIERIFGYRRPELLGKSLTMLMPERLREAHRNALKRYVATGKRRLPWGALELPGLRKDGREIPLEMSYGEYSREGKLFFTGIIRDVSTRKKIENALRESERHRLLIMDAVPALISYVGRDLRYQVVNRRYEEWFRRPASEIIGKQIQDILGEGPYNEVQEFVKKALRGERISYERSLDRDGKRHFLQVDYVPHIGPNSEVLGFFSLVTDVTDRKQIEESVRNANERLSSVLNSITEAYYALDAEWRLTEINREAEKIFGPADKVIGKIYWQQYPVNIGSDIDLQYHRAVREKRPVHFEARSGINNRWYEIHAYPRGTRLEIYFRDITERKEVEQELEKARAEAQHQAYHDPLTGLPNRLLFRDICGVEAAQARRNRRKLAILFLDLDRFKEINDSLGHDAGDQLLKAVARSLRRSVRESDTVARIGGDEFNILLSDLENADDITATARKIMSAFQNPYLVSGNELRVTTSIGIAIYPDDSREIETLLKYADMAMYHAKEHGRNRYQFYDPVINSRALERINIENSLRKAIEREEFVIHYLPQIDITTRKVAGAEALLRWRHSELGLLNPARFIPVAEETGLIIPLGKWLLRSVVRQMKAWQQAGYRPIPVIINLSRRQFHQKDLAETTARILGEAGLEPNRLQFEISEETAMRDVEFTRPQSGKLTRMGFGFSIDDYGTGCLPLNSLKKLPVQRLKIDQSLIRDILSDPDDRTIVDAMIAMSHSLKIKAVAEGVETDEQLRLLQECNCDEIQGFFFGEPLPAEEFEKMIAA